MRVNFRRGLRPALGAVVAFAVPLAVAAPASAHFPIPRCGWVSASVVHRSFGISVKAPKARWTTVIAPVLSCNLTERTANLQEPGKPIVVVQFRELARLKPQAGFVPVAHLGSCRRRVSCTNGQSAWLSTLQEDTSGLAPFTAGISLGVQTGLNSITIEVLNPFGPVPVSNEVGSAEALAKRLARRFRWK